MKLKLFLIGKMSIGFMVGFLIAYLFKLPYAFTAGVIAVLSLEPTRKRSFEIGFIRILDSLFAILLAILIFSTLGFYLWTLFLFIILFIPITFFINLQGGIVVSLVLISQLYLERDLNFSFNALYILLIGVGVAFLLNLYMPKLTLEIKRLIEDVDDEMNNIIQLIAKDEKPDFTHLDNTLKSAYENIHHDLENSNVIDLSNKLKYIDMRREQTEILKRISKSLINIKDIKEKRIIKTYLASFKNQIGESNYAFHLEEKLLILLNDFKHSELPTDRESFEFRAELYHILLELHQFLHLKLHYHEDTKEKGND